MWINLTSMFGKGKEPALSECEKLPYFTGMQSVKTPVLKTIGNITATYKPTPIMGDVVIVHDSTFHIWPSENGRFYKIPPHTQGFKISMKRNLVTAQTSGYVRIFLTIVDTINTNTITSDLQLDGVNYKWDLTTDVDYYEVVWNKDLSKYAGKYLVVSYRDHVIKTKDDFTVRVLALTDIENLILTGFTF